MRELTPDKAFAERLREVRKEARLTRAEVIARLVENVGYPDLSEQALGAIEREKRRVSLSEAFALAAALGVAPMHLMVPFEKPEPIFSDVKTTTDIGPIFEPDGALKVGEKQALLPVEARAWITGTQLPQWVPGPPDGGVSEFLRYYITEVPPFRRWVLNETASAVREQRTDDVKRLDRIVRRETAFPRMGVPGMRRGLPTALWTLLTQGRDDNGKEDDHG